MKGSVLAGIVGLLAFGSGSGGPAAAQAQAPAEVVVLVHGWHGAGEHDRLAGSSLATLGERLRADGFEVHWAEDVAVDPGDDLFASADGLARELARASAARPGRPLRLLAHSYGGLVARALLETERYERLRDRGVTVSHLVTLGSPMAGIDVWLPLLFVLGDPFGEPSVWELTPAWMAGFNATHAPPAGTRYTLVAGDARPQVPLLWLLPPSDGAVSVASALALPERSPGLQEILTDNLHGSTGATRLLGWRSLLDDAPTYRLAVRPGLAAPPAPPGPVLGRAGIAAGPARSAFSHTPVGSLSLAPGEERRLDLPASDIRGLLLAAEPGVTVVPLPGGGPAPWPLTGPAAPGGAQGSWLPLDGGEAALRLRNTGAGRAAIAWLGLLGPEAPALSLAARVVGGRLGLVASAGGRPLSATATVLGQGERRPRALPLAAAPAGAGGAALAGEADLVPEAGVTYVQVTARVGGQDVQAELTVLAAGAGPRPER